jgi:hypothetical protein
MIEEIGEFKAFSKIQNIGKLYMTITEKIHGSNAQIYIYRDENAVLQLKAGSRTRWLMPGDDNFGFAQFIYENKEEIISKLGEGRHFGEWAGRGINAGYNLPEKRLFLFNWRRWKSIENELPARISTVPLLYTGKMSLEIIDEIMDKLKENGSYISSGYMKPEGIVVEFNGSFYKKTFDIEEVKWSGKDPNKISIPREKLNLDHLLQPIRLRKLLSRDSRYIENYPSSIKEICADYVKDLEEENKIADNDDEVKGIKKALGGQIFYFIKSIVAEEISNQSK